MRRLSRPIKMILLMCVLGGIAIATVAGIHWISQYIQISSNIAE